VGSNAFDLNTLPFLVLHPMFKLDLLLPYFPSLLDTSKIIEHLTPTYLNLDYMEQESIVVDTQSTTVGEWCNGSVVKSVENESFQ
jgi:hypothetical protein